MKRSPRINGLIKDAVSGKKLAIATEAFSGSRPIPLPPIRPIPLPPARTPPSTPAQASPSTGAQTPPSAPAPRSGGFAGPGGFAAGGCPSTSAGPCAGPSTCSAAFPAASARPKYGLRDPAPPPAAFHPAFSLLEPAPRAETTAAASDPPPLPDSRVPRPAAPQWLYQKVPDQEPDAHLESQCEAHVSADGGQLLAARVRGKKHKHEGTNCDDWFEVRIGGRWTVIAVADGAGSRKFSRLGAKASCTKAAEMLAIELGGLLIPDRPFADGLVSKDDNQAAFLDPGVEIVQRSMHRAILAAAAAVEEAAQVRAGSPTHERLLGRPITPDDLAATFLLAAHTTLRIGESELSLTVGCQIGDGVIAAVSPRGEIGLLGRADSGE